MRCFNHSEVRAVGLCKSCAKGLCHDCLTDLESGLACKSQCEERVKAFREYNDLALTQGVKSLKYIQTNNKSGALFVLSFGVLLIGFGLFAFMNTGYGGWLFNCVLGGLFMFRGWQQRKSWK